MSTSTMNVLPSPLTPEDSDGAHPTGPDQSTVMEPAGEPSGNTEPNSSDGWVDRRVRTSWQVFRVSAKQSVAFSTLTTSLYFIVNRSRRKVPTKYLIRPTRKLFGLSLLLSFSYLYYTYQLEATHNALVNKLHHTWSGKYEKGELEEYAAKVQATGMQRTGQSVVPSAATSQSYTAGEG